MNALLLMTVALAVCTRYPGVLLPLVFYAYTAGGISGFRPLTSVLVGTALLLAAWSARHRLADLQVDAIDALVCAFFVYYVAAALFAEDPQAALQTGLFTAASFLSLYVLWRLLALARGLRLIALEAMQGFAVLGAAMAGLALIAEPAAMSPTARLMIGDTTAVGLSQPLPYALLSCIALAMLPRTSTAAAVFHKATAALCFGLIGYFSVLNGTRGIFITLLAGSACLYALQVGLRGALKLAVALAVGVAVVAGLLPVLQPYLDDYPGLARILDLQRYGQAHDASSLERMYRFDAAIEMFTQHLLFGAGPGEFDAQTQMDYPHNLYLELLSESGLVGALLFTFAFVLGLRSLRWLMAWQHDLPHQYIATLLFMGFVHQQFSLSLATGKALTLLALAVPAARRIVASRHIGLTTA